MRTRLIHWLAWGLEILSVCLAAALVLAAPMTFAGRPSLAFVIYFFVALLNPVVLAISMYRRNVNKEVEDNVLLSALALAALVLLIAAYETWGA